MQKKGDVSADVVVIGAGTVGAAIGYGVASRGVRVLVLDGGDRDFRAASANFGLVWLQGKGMNMPAYQQITRDSVHLWPTFCAEIENATKLELHYERTGGLEICLSDAMLEKRRAELLRLQGQLGIVEREWEMLDCRALSKLFPSVKLGSGVAGASLGHRDGHVNPLRLLRALHTGILRKGGRLRGGSHVHSIRAEPRGTFTINLGNELVSAARIVIAAGLGSKTLAAQLGLEIPLRPQKGQILVTERLQPFLPVPTSGLRQTREGTVMIGASHEEVGLQTSTTCTAAGTLSAGAISVIPSLKAATVVRQWAGLRILTPDGYPIYAESQSHPGVFVAVCHSGVTLAAAHATLFADAVIAGRLPQSLEAFHQRRFDVPKAA